MPNNQEILEEIKGNWEYEGCVKPEHVEWMIEKIEGEIING